MIAIIPLDPRGRPTHQSGMKHDISRTHPSKALEKWQKALRWEMQRHRFKEHRRGAPIRMETHFVYSIKDPKMHDRWKTTRPDTDNLIKTVKDMATKAGWWEDDSLVVDERITKSFGSNPRIIIKVEDVAETGPDLSGGIRMTKYKAKTYDGKEIVGTDIRLGSFFSHWMVHEYGETRIDPETIEVIEEGENNAATGK